MKSPLMYQLTELSCGETAMRNCLSFLFEREEMPLELVNVLSIYRVSCYGDEGRTLNKEFSDNIMYFISSWIEHYAKVKHIPLRVRYLIQEEVNLLEIVNCLRDGGCICLKTNSGTAENIVITGMNDEELFIFDSYYQTEKAYAANSGVEVVLDRPFEYNRKVKIERFLKEQKGKYMLGPEKAREAVLFYKNDSILQREFV